jgi:hypothetical protein
MVNVDSSASAVKRCAGCWRVFWMRTPDFLKRHFYRQWERFQRLSDALAHSPDTFRLSVPGLRTTAGLLSTVNDVFGVRLPDGRNFG